MVENRADNELFHLITDTGIASQIDMPPGHACVMMGQYMAEFHNTLISAYNAAYSQALGVKSGSQDAADLLLYCQIICELTHEHHDWEEKCYFPAIGQFSGEPDIMGSNVEEHGAFEHSLGEFNAWVLETKKEDYDGQKLKMLLEALVPTLGQHFQSEPPTFYRLKHLDSDGLKAVFDRAAKIALDASDPWRYAPLLFGCQDPKSLVNGEKRLMLHEAPFFAPYLVNYVFGWRYSGAWRFNPFDMFGRPRPLEFRSS